MSQREDSVEDFPVRSLAISGYRSFGPEPQFFEKFSKVNVIIGQNNCGKSNILKFISEILSKAAGLPMIQLQPIDKHLFGQDAELKFGMLPFFIKDREIDVDALKRHIGGDIIINEHLNYIKLLVQARKRQFGDINNPWYFFNANKNFDQKGWDEVFAELSDNKLSSLWNRLLGRNGGGDRQMNWIPDILNKLSPRLQNFRCYVVPAIRRISPSGNGQYEFGGDGIVERLAALQNPSVLEQEKKEKFKRIVQFLRTVTDCESADIEIPYNRDTILVTIDGKVLALDSLGSGIHEVIILAAAATLVEDSVICLEEPELHLNPILQKKLIRYLKSDTLRYPDFLGHSCLLK